MSLAAALLVLVSTATHAYWNYLVKVARGGTIFVGLTKVAETVILLPLFVLFMLRSAPDTSTLARLAPVGALLTLANYVMLSAAYQRGDLGLVYPVARASPLLLLPLLGYFALGERIGWLGAGGLLLIGAGIIVLQLGALSRSALRALGAGLRESSAVLALAAGAATAGYTVWDKRAVGQLPPFIYFYTYTALVSLCYAAFLIARFARAEVRGVWSTSWRSIVQVGVFNSLTYLLVLLALQRGTSSYVVGLRQLSIVWGVLLGRWLFGRGGNDAAANWSRAVGGGMCGVVDRAMQRRAKLKSGVIAVATTPLSFPSENATAAGGSNPDAAWQLRTSTSSGHDDGQHPWTGACLMKELAFRRLFQGAALAATIAFAAPSVVVAQQPADSARAQTTGVNNDVRDHDKDWGWLGLLGLAGLLGLRRREHHNDNVDNTTTRRPMS